MALFGGISERFWNYVSPRKPQESRQESRERAFKTPLLPHTKTAVKRSAPESESSGRLSMSPRSRVQSWKIARDDTYRPLGDRAPFATPSLGRLTPTREIPEMDLEGDTLLDNGSEQEEVVGDAAQYDANDETMVEEEYNLKEEVVIDIEEERKKWALKADEMREDGWSEDAIAIYIKIGARGFEPLLPAFWAFDFPTLPSLMFSSLDEEVFIKSTNGKEFRGIKALQNLMFLGTNIRDARHHYTSNRTSDVVAKRAIHRYFKWAREDGYVDGRSDIPTLAIEAGGVDVSAAQLQENMVLKLHKLADRYRDALRVHPSTEDEGDLTSNPPSEAEYTHELPTLYGIIASHTVLAFVSYDVAAVQPGLRIIGVFDYGDVHTDVWNSLAISQIVIHARNGMMKLQPFTKMELGDTPQVDNDPDA